jgi:SAM-dependent methyltransferase
MLRPPGPRRATGETDPLAQEGSAMGLGRSFWFPFFGVPRGPLGRVGARLLPVVARPLYAMVAEQLDLRPDDALLEVGCGSAGLLVEHASHVRHIAGLDASEIQVAMARRRLADRIAAGTAEVVLGDAMALPWDEGRFSVVGSVNCLKFVPDPLKALTEMSRVLRPDGGPATSPSAPSGDPGRTSGS